MTIAHFVPNPGDGRVAEDVEVLGPAHNTPDLAFVIYGLDSGRMQLAWSDELTFIAEPAEVLR